MGSRAAKQGRRHHPAAPVSTPADRAWATNRTAGTSRGTACRRSQGRHGSNPMAEHGWGRPLYPNPRATSWIRSKHSVLRLGKQPRSHEESWMAAKMEGMLRGEGHSENLMATVVGNGGRFCVGLRSRDRTGGYETQSKKHLVLPW